MAQIWRKFSNWLAPSSVALLLVATLARPAAAGTTYTVANVAELQAAIANVNAGVGGDLIVLGQGTYSLTGPLGYIFKDVTIQGDPAGTIVRGDGSFSIFSIRANNVSIENLTVQDAFTAISYEGASTFSGTGLTLTGSFYGIYFGDSRGTSNLTNSTITNNTFGVKVDCAGFNLTNVTVTGNEAGIDFASCGEQMGITNSLIVANGVDCTQWGAITPVGAASFDSDGTCVARGWPGMTTVALASLALQSLASNGGPTQTAAISPHSAAVDAGNNAACPAIDQRGRPRNDGFCDIGAYEAVSAAAGRDYFVATPDELAAAIFDAKNSSGRDRIFLAPVVFPINSSTIHSVRLLVDDSNGPNDIKLIGAGAAATILEGGGPADRNDVVTIDGSSLITIEKMTIENGGGFGIYNNGNLVLRDVIVRNHAGMGIQSVNAGLAIFGSTISGNGAALNGACCEAAIYVESTFSAVNTTIAGNPTTGLFIASTGGGASLLNVTIDGNAGAGLAVVNGPITITNTIVADNAGGDCDSSIASHATLGGPNLFGDGSCGFGASGSARLGPLQDNGGPTPTMELLAGSPAIDAAGAACVVTDQRGIARPQGAACDIGAFELVPSMVNGAPTCDGYSGSTLAAAQLSDTLACSDPDANDTFTVAEMSGPSNGVLTLNPDGTFTYLPTSGFSGTDSFTFQATDAVGAVSNVATATITVTNQSPSCANYTGSVTIGDSLNESVGCADPDAGDTLTVSLVSGASTGNLTFSADGTFTYTPANGSLGTVAFTYQATDSHGAVSAVGTATITVLISHPPVCGDFTGSTLFNTRLDVATAVNRICSDPDGDAFSYSIVTDPAHGVASVLPAGAGIFYRADYPYIGNVSFTFMATDSNGVMSNIGTATITVVNLAQTCSNFSGSVLSGMTLQVGDQLYLPNALCDAPDSDSIKYSVVTGPAHGTAFVQGLGTSLYYAASQTYIGSDSFTFKVTDVHGAESNIVTATIQVVTTAPTCQNFTATVGLGGSLPLLQLLRGACTDPDPFDSLTFSFVTNAAHGTLNVAGGLAYLAINTSYLGPDSFTYQATDSHGVVSNIGTATIQIVNTAAGSQVVVSPDPAVSLRFINISAAGTTTAVSSTTGPPTPAGFNIPGSSLYWEISTTATYSSSISVCIQVPAGVTPARLLHYQGGAWVDVTDQVFTGLVCGWVTSLSPFVVAVPVPPSADVAAQLQQLQAMVESFNLRKPATKKFIHRLDEVQDAWADTRHHKHSAQEFCKNLEKFMRDVEKATGKTLTAAEAAQLLALAQLIAGAGGCGS